MSLAIFMRLTATVLRAPLISTTPAWASREGESSSRQVMSSSVQLLSQGAGSCVSTRPPECLPQKGWPAGLSADAPMWSTRGVNTPLTVVCCQCLKLVWCCDKGQPCVLSNLGRVQHHQAMSTALHTVSKADMCFKCQAAHKHVICAGPPPAQPKHAHNHSISAASIAPSHSSVAL